MREQRTESRPHASASQGAPSPKETPRRRLFFALWPTEVEQHSMEAVLRDRVAASRGRAIPSSNLHVTLAFLGGVEEERFAAVTRSAASIAAGEPVTLSFDQLEIWSRSHVLCLTARTPAPLDRLVEGLRFNLLKEQFEIRPEEYRPHVTLARDVKARGVREPIAPIAWRFEDFVLVQSQPGPSGSLYRVIERWPLAR